MTGVCADVRARTQMRVVVPFRANVVPFSGAGHAGVLPTGTGCFVKILG